MLLLYVYTMISTLKIDIDLVKPNLVHTLMQSRWVAFISLSREPVHKNGEANPIRDELSNL